MASNRIRSLRSVATRLTRVDSRVAYLERRPPATRLGDFVVAEQNLAPGAVATASIADGSIVGAKINQTTTIVVDTIDANNFILPGWTVYTPSLGGTGWSVGNGTLTGSHIDLGSTIIFWARLTAGSTTSYGSVSPTLSLPLPTTNSGVPWPISCNFLDASTALRWTGVPSYSSTSIVVCNAIGSNGVQTAAISTYPFTFTTSDEIHLYGTYEAA